MTGTPFLYDEPELSNLKLQEALFFVSNFSYFIFGFTWNQAFQTYLCFLLKLTLKSKSTNSVFELISVVIWKPIPVDDPSIWWNRFINFVDYSRLRTEIRVHQLIEHQSTGHTPVGHESTAPHLIIHENSTSFFTNSAPIQLVMSLSYLVLITDCT